MYRLVPRTSIIAALVLVVAALAPSGVSAQTYEVLRGDACPECAADEHAVRVWGETRDGRSVQEYAPCAHDPHDVLTAAAERGDLAAPAFALPVPSDARPDWFRDFLVSLSADFQHPLARLLNGFTSECLVLGVHLDEGQELRGYRLGASSHRTDELPCRTTDGNCSFHATGFSTTPTVLQLAGGRWVVAVFRHFGPAEDVDGGDRTAFLTVYRGVAGR